MSYNYNNLLVNELYGLQASEGLSNFEFIVDDEQSFIKRKDLKPNTIYVLTRNLQSDKSIGVDTQPVQLLILSEQNSLEVSKAFFSKFAQEYNFKSVVDGTTWIKQQYSDPVVLSNFNTIDYGYRSVLYISATLYIMEDVIDIKNLKIDGADVTALSFNMAYQAQMNTQQFFTHYIAESVKSVASLTIAFTIPVVKSALTTKITNIIHQTTGYTGNEDFTVSFTLNDLSFSYNMKLMSAEFGSAPNQIPSLQVGMIL